MWPFRRKPVDDPEGTKFTESQNMGTRHETFDEADLWWATMLLEDKGPFLTYTFPTRDEAYAAILEVDYFHLAQDSGKIICSEPLIYGCFPFRDGGWSVEVAGRALSHERWTAARDAFLKHNGSCHTEKPPGSERPVTEVSSSPRLVEPQFVREQREPNPPPLPPAVYRIYRAPNAASAKDFLQRHPIDENLLYLVVETPEGNFGRDINGIYQE
jgi:hypothetical protein